MRTGRSTVPLAVQRANGNHRHSEPIMLRTQHYFEALAIRQTEFSTGIVRCRAAPPAEAAGVSRSRAIGRRVKAGSALTSERIRNRPIPRNAVEGGAGAMSKQNESVGDDLFRLAVCAFAAALAAWSLLGRYADVSGAAASAAALIHLRPFSLAATRLEWLQDAPLLGKSLFRPAVAAAGVPLEVHALAALDAAARRSLLASSGLAAALIYTPCLLLMAANAWRARPDIAFRTVHGLDSLLAAQSARWPSARLALRFPWIRDSQAGRTPQFRTRGSGSGNAGKLLFPERPPPVPPHASCSMRPERWLELQGLVGGPVEPATASAQNQCGSPAMMSDSELETLTPEALCESLDRQLGKPWRGFSALAPSARALAAAFALFRAYDVRGGQELLDRLAECSVGGRAARSGMDEAIRSDSRLSKDLDGILESQAGSGLLAIANRHAWETTAMIGMLQAARKDRGVVASASFVWLKREHRGFWYALNNSGNAAIMAEAAGAFAHFRAERQIGRPLRRPATHQAARALLENYLDAAPERIARRKALARRRSPVGARLERLAERT